MQAQTGPGWGEVLVPGGALGSSWVGLRLGRSGHSGTILRLMRGPWAIANAFVVSFNYSYSSQSFGAWVMSILQ